MFILLADRDRSGQRDDDPSMLVWIAFLMRLKETGMPIREMLHHAALRQQGRATEPERHALLVRHRDRVAAVIADLQANLLALDAKISGYAGAHSEDEPS